MSWGLIAIALLAAICALSAWWWLPKWEVERLRPQISDPKARADVEDNLRKSIGQLIGGAAVILAAGLAYYQTQQTLQTQSQHSKDTLQAQDEQSKRAITSQQVSKGFELLSETENPVKRLGGIYALEGVMNTSEQYHESVLDTLCAFVRFSTATSANEDPTTDVQAALTVIRRRAAGLGKVVLAGAQIPKAVLDDAKLIGADLNRINLSRAKLNGVDLSGGASLVEADLTDAVLFGANLSGANLSRARLNGAQPISVYLIGATLIDADLSDVNLNGADLSGAKLNGARLDKADLSDARNLTQVQLDEACGTETKLPPPLTIKPCQSR